jgi:hypothetical protein
MDFGHWGYLALSIIVPLCIYALVYRLLWRAKVSSRAIIMSLAWGVIAFGIIYGLQGQITSRVFSLSVLMRFGMPILETLGGSVFLFWLLYRRQIPDYVAGAAYGTAVMIAIAIMDNVFYDLVGGTSGQGPFFFIFRLITVNNIYAVSGALAGFGVGMVRFEQTTLRKTLWAAGGVVAAALWRSAYNNLVTTVQGTYLIFDAIIFAVGGIGLMVAIMRSTQSRHAIQALQSEKKRADDLINVVIPLGVSLSAERDFTRMLETIVEQARKFANADGGTLYLRTADESLEAVVIRNQRLGIFAQGVGVKEVIVEPLMLFDGQGQPDETSIAASVVHRGETLNIPDVYSAAPAYPGPRQFDNKMNYRTTSCLCLPLKNETGKAVGALQLINARSPLTREAIPFEPAIQQSLESLSALASAALTSYIRTEALRREAQEFTIDQEKVAKHVAEITDSEFFSTLRDRVKKIKTQTASAS